MSTTYPLVDLQASARPTQNEPAKAGSQFAEQMPAPVGVSVEAVAPMLMKSMVEQALVELVVPGPHRQGGRS